MIPPILEALKLLSFVPVDDLKKLIKSKDGKIIDIWGNCESLFTDKAIIKKIHEDFGLDDVYTSVLKDKDINKEYPKLYLVAKIGIFKSIKRFFNTFFKTICERRDLNFITRLYLSFIKSKFAARHTIVIFPLIMYRDYPEPLNNLFKKMFEDKIIDRIYLYKYEKTIENT